MIPYEWPKTREFNFFPLGVTKVHDAGKWALYHWPAMFMSFVVIDFPDKWKINHYAGLLTVTYTKDFYAAKPCCNS